MFIQYHRTLSWTSVIINAGTNGDGLITCAQKTTTGAPAATANKYIAGCIVQNLVSSKLYVNSGSTASPVWSEIDTGAGLTLPLSITDSTSTTGTSLAIIASALTTGVGLALSAVGLTTGKIYRAVAAAATMVGAGRYFEANDGATNVFGIGPNGHIHTAQTTLPTIAVTTANGISAAAITAGGTDVCGIITTTGTNNAGGATVLDITFNKTYTTAPKTVCVTPRNAAAAKAAATSLATPYVSAISATGFTLTIPSDASAGATPSFQYQVIA